MFIAVNDSSHARIKGNLLHLFNCSVVCCKKSIQALIYHILSCIHLEFIQSLYRILETTCLLQNYPEDTRADKYNGVFTIMRS